MTRDPHSSSIAADNAHSTVDLPKPTLLLIAFAQGVLLLFLHQAIESNFWPGDNMKWLVAFYTGVLIAPLMALLSLKQKTNWRILIAGILGFSLIASLLGFYTGAQIVPGHGQGAVLSVYTMALTVATFKALMYNQLFANGETLSYSRLFQLSWRNFLTLSLSLLFTLCVFGIFALWASLFKIINIRIFEDIFFESWFLYPVLGLAHGIGIVIFRSQSQIIDTIRRIQQTLMKFLLVFLIGVSLLFLAALPFTGLSPIWETGKGSFLMLTLQGILLFFVNAVYQDDASERPYSLWLHRFIYLGVATTPIYSLMVAYGLWLRIDQHGLSILRLWAVLIWVFFSCFSLGYLWGIIKQRDQWLEQLSWVNIRLGLAVVAVMLLVNSPLLDFRKMVVNSQMQRLAAGETSPEDFDIYYFRRYLAKPGQQALNTLDEQWQESHPQRAHDIEFLYTSYEDKQTDMQERYMSSIQVIGDIRIEGELEQVLRKYLGGTHWGGPDDAPKRFIMSVDLNNDGSTEYAILEQYQGYLDGSLVYPTDDGHWMLAEFQVEDPSNQDQFDLAQVLENGDWQQEASQWQNLRVGGQLFKLRHSYNRQLYLDPE